MRPIIASMVLVAMLVPMAVLVRGYGNEDQLLRAALEVQATETAVSGQDKGAVAVYLDRINDHTGTRTTVLYPDGTGIGPTATDLPPEWTDGLPAERTDRGHPGPAMGREARRTDKPPDLVDQFR